MNKDKSKENFWNDKWLQNEIGWDIGYASPAITAYFEKESDKNIKILIPGCGNAYEAEWLLKNGFNNITVIDISEKLIADLKQKFNHNPKINIIHGDFFEHIGQYDVIVEQTFFCAILPTLRSDYVNQMHQLLKTNGRLIGLLFNRTFEGGPPYSGSLKEYEALFKDKFKINTMENCEKSITPRINSELFIIFEKN